MSLQINSQEVPIDFIDAADTFITFDGADFSTRNNPKDSGNKVGQFLNNGANETQGFYRCCR
jgi:hypothetical protein